MYRFFYFQMFIFLSVGSVIGGSNDLLIQSYNDKVRAYNDSISRDEYSRLRIDEYSETEGSPPKMQFYFSDKQLIAVFISVGHETWSTEFRYYYHANGQLLKFLKMISDRPDKPGKKAIICSEDGGVLWKNTEHMPITSNDLLDFFHKLQKTRLKFSKY